MKYPIDATVFLRAVEDESSGPLPPTIRKMWEYIIGVQNQAYKAGQKDGFMERFKGADEVAPTAPNSAADAELVDALKEFREKMDKAFDEECFDIIVSALGAPPSGMSLGQCIYAMVCEAFFQGGLYAILLDDKEENDV